MRLNLLCLLSLLACAGDKGADPAEGDALSTDEDADGDGYAAELDCNEAAPDVHVGAVELCDGIDNNCDGEVDEGVAATSYADSDGDGFGDPSTGVEACATPAGNVANDRDCDDGRDDVFPGAEDRCDEVDNDCDGEIDEDEATVWYADADGDTFGDPLDATTACAPPAGHVANGEDCDDTSDLAAPGLEEVCDERDNNCDGAVDEDVTRTFFEDRDGDGYGLLDATAEACAAPVGYADQSGDCDDDDTAFHPGALEEDCTDPNDYNCDGSVAYADADLDSYAACVDCDDSDPARNPLAIEVCNGVDDDCDGHSDDDDGDVDLSTATTFYEDDDADGYGDPLDAAQACALPAGFSTNALDCDDRDAAIKPTASEVCDDADNDCDALIDDADSSLALSSATVSYRDADADSYGLASSTRTTCDLPSGYVLVAGDCNDASAAISPADPEVCNGVDDDCDGLSDDADSSLSTSTATTWYRDGDGDGYGRSSTTSLRCTAPSGYVATSGDCDDADTAYNPGAAAGCDGEDYNCDGLVDNDDDIDTYADLACGGDDCDDSDASIKPESSGVCALGLTCKDILDEGRSSGDGVYTIDPDGYATGLSPFDVTCDMTTDGGGWTMIEYAADLAFQNHFSGGDSWRKLSSDFTFVLSAAQIQAIQDNSTEGSQLYVGRCEHVIHYYYSADTNYTYAFGFELWDGTLTPYGGSSYAPYSVSVTADGCKGNGGEGGSLSKTTNFKISSVLLPLVNIRCRDCGDAPHEKFGSNLTDNPAWLR